MSWEDQSKDSWYVGTSTKHYGTFNIWIKEMKAIQNCDALFFQHRCQMQTTVSKQQPTVSKADVVATAVMNLIKTLKGNLAAVNNESELEALNQLVNIFFKESKRMSTTELNKC